MPLELTIDSLDAVDETVRPLYVEKGGKFHLDVNGLPDTGKLTRALESERKAKADYEARLRQYSGVDVDRYQQLLSESEKHQQEAADRERKELEARGQYEKALADREAAHKAALERETAATRKALAEREAEVVALRTSMQRDKLEAEATRAIASARGVTELLLPHVKAMTRVVDQGGTLVVEVLDVNGNPRTKGSGEPFGLSDLVAEMRSSPIFARAFEADGTRGTGSGSGNGVGGNGVSTIDPSAVDRMSMNEYKRARADGRIS